jgi:hypothetical protein
LSLSMRLRGLRRLQGNRERHDAPRLPRGARLED